MDRTERFNTIYREHKNLVAKICWLYVGDGAPFDDLFQEAMANIWSGLDSWRGDSKLSTWLYRIVINSCISWHRQQRRHGGGISLENLPVHPEAPPESSAAADYAMLMALVARLDPLEKAIISMWLDEKPYDDIAEVTGLGKSNVAVRIHRIKQKLANLAHEYR